MNSDGAVDAADYIVLRELLGPANFTSALLQADGPATVPEPSGRLLVLTAGAITLGIYANERPPRANGRAACRYTPTCHWQVR